MASVFGRSKSSRSFTIDDSFHREQQQQQRRWAKGRSRSISSSRRLVRSNSVSSDYARAAGTMPPSSSPSASASKKWKGRGGKGKHMLRSVVGFLSRTKSGRFSKPGSFTMTEPASPASASSLSRTNSDSSGHGTGRGHDSGRVGGAGGTGGASRPRVSFDAVVQTVFIEQMKEEEVRNTFYCRTEYAAFKEAYRTHRDTSTDWCRGNDVLPCNCDACQDDLVQGGGRGRHIYSSMASTASAPTAFSLDRDNYDSAFEAPPPPPSPYAYGHKATGEGGDDGGEEEEEEEKDAHAEPPPTPPSPYAYGHKENHKDNDGAEGTDGGQEPSNEPPSPVAAVFQDIQEDSSGGGRGVGSGSCSGSSSSSSGNRSSCSRGSRARSRKCPSTSSTSRYSSAARRHAAAHRQRGTWGVGSVPIAAPPVGRAYKRGGSLDDWGATSTIQDAVKCHGEGYAYKTLRLQGFSDLYIRTHFLPEG